MEGWIGGRNDSKEAARRALTRFSNQVRQGFGEALSWQSLLEATKSRNGEIKTRGPEPALARPWQKFGVLPGPPKMAVFGP